MSKLEFTGNETMAMMHEDKAACFRRLADYFEKFQHEYTVQDVVEFLRECADEQEAQAIVVDLRDNL